ncbi:transposase [Rhodococcus sp. WMMA185]|nr:transposase [Rhodococcus sp. WMMA185]
MVNTVLQAYRFALDPTPTQEEALRSHCGAQRFTYNWGLAVVKANLDQRAAERSYGIADADLTAAVDWSAYSLRKHWNQIKNETAPWWAENSKEAYSSGMANLAAALSNWSTSRSRTRKGRRVGFPRFKGKRSALSCRFSTGAFGLADSDRRHVRLPRIGIVRTHESTRKLARRVDAGTARIRSATVSFRRGRWFVSFSVQVQRTSPAPVPRATAAPSVVGVDLGVKTLAVLSTGEMIENPKHLEHAQKKLRRLNRQAARRVGWDKRTGQQPSSRWLHTQDRVAKLLAYVADARRDGLHKLSTRLVRTHDVVVLEDLNVAGMLRTRSLARHIAGVGMGEVRRQSVYKAGWQGTTVHIADRWYPSSKTCSACGEVKAKLSLKKRVFKCDCGLRMDRDLNAARNLAALVQASSPSCGATVNEPDGTPRKARTVRAAGIATGRLTPRVSQGRGREVPAQGTDFHIP